MNASNLVDVKISYFQFLLASVIIYLIPHLVLGKSVGLCKTSKRKDHLYISLLVSVWRIICENFNPNGLILAEI